MTNIFVGNLPYETTDSQLAEAFGAYGAVERASVVLDRYSGESRGFGFVEMTNGSEAMQAMSALNGQDFNGRTLNVNEAHAREQRGGGYGRGNGAANHRDRDSRW